jgi:hypothetical protein
LVFPGARHCFFIKVAYWFNRAAVAFLKSRLIRTGDRPRMFKTAFECATPESE